METSEYLKAILADQDLKDDSAELKNLRESRKEVESVLRDAFPGAAPRIQYAGSYKKGSLNREAYDLDIAFFLPEGDDGAGETLEDIYNNTRNALATKYVVESKRSALRLMVQSGSVKSYLHIDVVPGRFTDGSDGDCFLYQANAKKCRLKTNIGVHVEHIRDSGVVPAIRLLKLWKVRRYLSMKQFVLELLIVQELSGLRQKPLEEQLIHFWEIVRDAENPIWVEDPANPRGNDLSSLVTEAWYELSSAAGAVLQQIDTEGWESVLGPLSKAGNVDEKLRAAAASVSVSSQTRPWLP